MARRRRGARRKIKRSSGGGKLATKTIRLGGRLHHLTIYRRRENKGMVANVTRRKRR
jgi:hypothetical protein